MKDIKHEMSIIRSIKFWLIEKIAAGDSIMLNTSITIEDRRDLDYSVRVSGVDGMLVVGCDFNIEDNQEFILAKSAR